MDSPATLLWEKEPRATIRISRVLSLARTQTSSYAITPNNHRTIRTTSSSVKTFLTSTKISRPRELPAHFAASVGYIGSRGTRLRSDFGRLNALPLEALRLGNPLLTKPLADVTAAERAYAT